MKERPGQSVAVIGAGVAGLTAAYLLKRHHSVTIFEQNKYLGGHTNTVVIDKGHDHGTAIDTGFIVYNDRTYPTFSKLLALLNVAGQPTNMSFGFQSRQSGLEYSTNSLTKLFAQPRNIYSSSFHRMVRDIFRFMRQAREDANSNRFHSMSLGAYLLEHKFSYEFIDDFIAPLGASLWSCPTPQMLSFPAVTFLRFFLNHGYLQLSDRPTWYTVRGGSFKYVTALHRFIEDSVRIEQKVISVARDASGVKLKLNDGKVEQFDRVIIACHADQALKLLHDPSPAEQRLLSAWQYEDNLAVLHTDDSVMPKIKKIWSSWNFCREKDEAASVSITYYMNLLQSLKTKSNYFVTLNPRSEIREESILGSFNYTHPQYTLKAIEAQSELPALNGVNSSYFCGSYFGYGFHEDAVKSASNVGAAFGCSL